MANDDSNGGGGICCLRGSLVIFNTIALLAGLATLGIGLYLIFNDAGDFFIPTNDGSPNKLQISTGDMKLISIFLLSIGSLVTFVSSIGCTGACVKSRCLLMSYLLTVTLILALQLLIAITAFVYREPIGDTLHDELMANLKRDYEIFESKSVQRDWDLMQYNVQCCGVDNYRDWFDTKAWPGKNYVPDSCCILSNTTSFVEGCGRNENPSSWYNVGCLEKIKGCVLGELHILASIVITLIFLQLFGIIASLIVFFHAKPPKPKSPQYKAYLYERARM